MNNAEMAEFQNKYLKVIFWMESLAFNNLHGHGLSLSEIKAKAREHTINETGCTPEYFDKIAEFIDAFAFQSADRNIAECYYDYLESTRKALES